VRTSVYSSAVKETNKTSQQTKDAVANVLEKIEEQMAGGNFKATLADYIRLLQFHKEMSEEQPTEMTVTWVDAPCTKK